MDSKETMLKDWHESWRDPIFRFIVKFGVGCTAFFALAALIDIFGAILK